MKGLFLKAFLVMLFVEHFSMDGIAQLGQYGILYTKPDKTCISFDSLNSLLSNFNKLPIRKGFKLYNDDSFLDTSIKYTTLKVYSPFDKIAYPLDLIKLKGDSVPYVKEVEYCLLKQIGNYKQFVIFNEVINSFEKKLNYKIIDSTMLNWGEISHFNYNGYLIDLKSNDTLFYKMDLEFYIESSHRINRFDLKILSPINQCKCDNYFLAYVIRIDYPDADDIKMNYPESTFLPTYTQEKRILIDPFSGAIISNEIVSDINTLRYDTRVR